MLFIFVVISRIGVVPIVMGAPLADYEAIAPAHSFIHVDQYESPRELAAYLHLLNTHDTLYNEYFKWRDTYEIADTNFMCRLCLLLQTTSYVDIRYKNINTWWNEGQCLSLGDDELKANWTSWRDLQL